MKSEKYLIRYATSRHHREIPRRLLQPDDDDDVRGSRKESV
ncbi:MAG: hypothetical protein V1823_00585 [Chloroflexota bacterium]